VIRSGSSTPRAVFLSDPSGVVRTFVDGLAARLPLEVREFGQAGLLAATAAREGADLAIIAGPRSLAPLERLHNDPRTRGVPVLLITSELKDEEARFKALAITDQVLDFPPEESVLELRIEQLLADRETPAGLHDYATARLEHEATAHWASRVCWVSGSRLLLETDVELPESAEVPLAGPALAQQGLSAAWARVVSCGTEHLHYNHAVSLELELLERPDALVEALRAEPHCQAAKKTKLTVVTDEPARLTAVAGAVDHTRHSIRWLRQLEGLAKHTVRFRPALILIDPTHRDLEGGGKFGALRKLQQPAPPVLPFEAPDDPAPWERLGERCPRVDPPPLEDGAAFAAMIDQLAEPGDAGPADEERIYLKREHRFSHARVAISARLSELSEVAGGVKFDVRVHAGGRLRLDVPDLQRTGIRPLYGRVLRTARPSERVQVLFMGVGGEAEARKLRSHVQGVIMEARRREYSQQERRERE
jgi:hypothetical protein